MQFFFFGLQSGQYNAHNPSPMVDVEDLDPLSVKDIGRPFTEFKSPISIYVVMSVLVIELEKK